MAQCANTQYTICTESGSWFLDTTEPGEIFQAISGNLSIDYVTVFPAATQYTPGQTFNLLGGTATVQNGGVSWSGPAGATGNQQLQICATDNDGQTCCVFNLVFDPDNCSVTGGNCLSLTVNDGDTITPGQVQQGATSFGSPVVAGVNGVSFSNDTSTSVTVACTGSSNGSIDLRMADGTICTVNVNCGVVGGGCLNLTVNDGDVISPAQVQGGATSFGSPVVAGVNGVSFSNDTSTSVTVACTGAANGSIALRMADGTICTVNVNCGAVSGDCLAFTDTSQTGSTVHQIFPSDVHGTATAFASPAIVGEVDPDNCILVTNDQTDFVGYQCTGECNGAELQLRLEGVADPCTVTINCQGTVVTNPNCAVTSLTVTPNQVIDGSVFASGTTAPYTVVASSNGFATVSGGDLVIGSLADGATFSSTITVQDANGGSVSCPVQFTVEDNNVACIDVNDSTVLATPQNAGPGTTVLINANINPSTGGLSGYYLRVKDFNGNFLTDPTFSSGTTWTWAVPNQCTDGTYTICVVPPDSSCPTWNSAETFGITGCSNTGGECDFQFDGDCPVSSPINPQPGDVVTVSLATNQCDCPGYTLTWGKGRVVNGNVVANPRDIGNINTANPYAPTYTIPADAQPNEQYGIYPICCPV